LHKQHLYGLATGAVLGGVAWVLGPALGYTLALNDGIFWGAVIGGILSGLPDFTRSGAILTRGNSHVVNLVVGLTGSLLFVAIFAGIVLLLMNLLL
jgi:hypothetical protein